MKKIYILIFLITLSLIVTAQNWYKDALKRERMLRPGIGIQGMEGQGLVLQLNRGHFCHNSYFPYFIIEASWTRENTLHFLQWKDKSYSNGNWGNGGNQWSSAFHYSFIHHDNWRHVVFALMVGAGLELGKRPFQIDEQKFLQAYQGYNLYARLNINGPTIKLNKNKNPMMTNVSGYIGIKYHKEWNTSFEYLRPNLGLIFNLLFPRKIAG